jgi:hypothetical protein
MDSHAVIDTPAPASIRGEPFEEASESNPRSTRDRRESSIREDARATALGLAEITAATVRPNVVWYTLAAFAVGFVAGRTLR